MAVSGALMVDGSAVPRRRVVVVLYHLYASSDLVLLIRPGDTVDYGGVVGARAANNGGCPLRVSASAPLHERA